MAVVAVSRCVAVDWAMTGDRKRYGLCDRRIGPNASIFLLSNVQKEIIGVRASLNHSEATSFHLSCRKAAHRKQQVRAAARPKTRSDSASMQQPVQKEKD